MVEQRCFVFRTYSGDFVQNELKAGRLRQGWSPLGGSLLNDDGEKRDAREWAQVYECEYGEPPSKKRYGILCRMLEMKMGDLVFCPKAPDSQYFTIAEVSGSYRFENQDNFGHIIPVKNQCVVSNWHDDNSQIICELFKSAHFRPAVTQVQEYKNERVFNAAKRLLDQENTETPQDAERVREQRYEDGRRKAAESLMKHVNEAWGFDQFEAAVGEAFKRKGYERLRGNSPRNGGDADHVFALPMPGFSDAALDITPTPLLIVQVKHKTGTDYDDVDGVNQLVNWAPYEGEEVLYKVLFSSADCFTQNCRNIAEAQDVILICGTDAGLFML